MAVTIMTDPNRSSYGKDGNNRVDGQRFVHSPSLWCKIIFLKILLERQTQLRFALLHSASHFLTFWVRSRSKKWTVWIRQRQPVNAKKQAVSFKNQSLVDLMMETWQQLMFHFGPIMYFNSLNTLWFSSLLTLSSRMDQRYRRRRLKTTYLHCNGDLRQDLPKT